MKKIDLTNEIPEIGGLIEISERIEQMEILLDFVQEKRNKIAMAVLEKLSAYEEQNNVWLGDNITVAYQKANYLIKGLNDDENEVVNVTPIEFSIIIKDKQTKGTEGEKE